MKNGFRLVYHKSLKGEDRADAEDELNDFVLALNGSHKYAERFNCKGGHASALRWKALGYPVNWCRGAHDKMVLRRLSKNRRIFGVVPRSLVFSLNDNTCSTRYTGCVCPKCPWHWTGYKGFTMAEPYKDSDYIIFYESGEIKG